MTIRLLVVGAVWPEPESSAAGAHLLQVLRPLIAQGWEVEYASTAAPSDHAFDLSTLGVSERSAKVNDSEFDDFVIAFQPDVVLFDRFYIEEQFGWRVEKAVPDALRILNTEDLHFLRDARERTQKGGQRSRPLELQSDLARREIAAILRSDLSLIISGAEMTLLTEHFQISPDLIHYCPFMLDPPQALEIPSYEERRDFFCVGNFRHAPNWDAVRWMKTEIWPRIRRRLPEANLHIAGAYASKEQMALHAPMEGFWVDGRIPEADAAFRAARICLAPLRFGAGLKGKLLDAMRTGTPFVTTEIGSEGLFDDSIAGGLAGDDDADSLAARAVELYGNPTLWRAVQREGFVALSERFDRGEHEAKWVQRIEAALGDRDAGRARNFIGSILRDQHHRSTRYMSLWIEAKNRGLEAANAKGASDTLD